MKKALFLLGICIPLILRSSSLLTPSGALTTQLLAQSTKPVLAYSKLTDVQDPRKRIGQYSRTATIKPERPSGIQYYFGEYISIQKEKGIVIEFAQGADKIPGVGLKRVAFLKDGTALYLYNPVATNIDTLSKQAIQSLIDWLMTPEEDKTN